VDLTATLFFTWNPALVGFVSGMCSDVLLKMRELGKLSLADLTSVGFNTKMYSSMLGQVRAVCECFPTTGAFIRFRFPQVNLGVELKVSFAGKSLKQN
jgi:hypothetical protein